MANDTQLSDNGTCEVRLACSVDTPVDNVSIRWHVSENALPEGADLSTSWDPASSGEQTYTCEAKNPVSRLVSSLSARSLCQGNGVSGARRSLGRRGRGVLGAGMAHSAVARQGGGDRPPLGPRACRSPPDKSPGGRTVCPHPAAAPPERLPPPTAAQKGTAPCASLSALVSFCCDFSGVFPERSQPQVTVWIAVAVVAVVALTAVVGLVWRRCSTGLHPPCWLFPGVSGAESLGGPQPGRPAPAHLLRKVSCARPLPPHPPSLRSQAVSPALFPGSWSLSPQRPPSPGEHADPDLRAQHSGAGRTEEGGALRALASGSERH